LRRRKLVEEEEDLDVEDNVGLEIISDEIEESFKKFEVVVTYKLDGILAVFKKLRGWSIGSVVVDKL